MLCPGQRLSRVASSDHQVRDREAVIRGQAGTFGEIDRLDEPSVQAAGLANVGVEIGQALDVDQTSGHDPPFFQKNLPH